MDAKLSIITGPSGSGKSDWCAQLVEEAKAGGKRVGGLLSQPVLEDGVKIGIDLVDIATGEAHRLANPRQEVVDELTTECWQLKRKTLDWANKILRELAPCDLVVIDELGPLEFLREDGLNEGVRLIDDLRFPRIVVVVRPGLLPQALDRWPAAQVIDIHSNSGYLPGTIQGVGLD